MGGYLEETLSPVPWQSGVLDCRRLWLHERRCWKMDLSFFRGPPVNPPSSPKKQQVVFLLVALQKPHQRGTLKNTQTQIGSVLQLENTWMPASIKVVGHRTHCQLGRLWTCGPVRCRDVWAICFQLSGLNNWNGHRCPLLVGLFKK